MVGKIATETVTTAFYFTLSLWADIHCKKELDTSASQRVGPVSRPPGHGITFSIFHGQENQSMDLNITFFLDYYQPPSYK